MILAFLRISYFPSSSMRAVELVVSYLHQGQRRESTDLLYVTIEEESIEHSQHALRHTPGRRQESLVPLCVYGLHDLQVDSIVLTDRSAHHIYVCGCQPPSTTKLSLSEKETLRLIRSLDEIKRTSGKVRSGSSRFTILTNCRGS